MKETMRSKEAIKAWPSEIATLNKIVSEQTKSYKGKKNGNKTIKQLIPCEKKITHHEKPRIPLPSAPQTPATLRGKRKQREKQDKIKRPNVSRTTN